MPNAVATITTADECDAIQCATRDLARRVSRAAKASDEACLKHADPRAVQGGDMNEEGDQLRQFARRLNAIANDMAGTIC